MTCGVCGDENREGAAWCERCLTRFDRAPETRVATERDVRRAAQGSDAFARTSSVNLTRLSVRKPLFYEDPLGKPVARVHEQRVVDEGKRYLVSDLDDVPLFHVERYAAAQRSWAVIGPDGAPLAAYVVRGLVRREVEVRDGTSAPVATMTERSGRWTIVETGGPKLGFCWRQEVTLGDWIDEKWGLATYEVPSVLDRRALVAAPLVCRLVAGREPRPRPQSDRSTWSGASVAVDLAGLFD